ncbi:MAG: ZIP family metal transporter [Acidimicrobiales bacterium]
MTAIAIAAVLLGTSLAAGLAPRTFAHRLSTGQLGDLTGAASGLLLASALLVVIPEGFHTAAEAAHESGSDEAFAYSPVVLGAAILAGFVLMLLLEGFGVGHAVHEEHHDHAEGHGHDHVHHPTSSTVLALGLSVHALADGLAIGAAAAAGDAAFSLLVAAGVIVHRIPAALSLGLFSLHQSNRRFGGTDGVILFAIATPLAILVSFAALDGADESLVALALLFSAGTFLYVATVDTLPQVHNPETGRRAVRNIVVTAGLFTLALLVIESQGLLDHGH